MDAAVRVSLPDDQRKRDRDIRKQLRQHTKKIGISDCTIRKELRNWLWEIDTAIFWIQTPQEPVFHFVSFLAIGGLGATIRSYMDDQPIPE